MRHGETEWNLQNRMQGQLDSPLTQKGQAQAVKMGQILNREIADPHNYHMYTSPLGRTMHTSELVAQNFEFKPIKSDLLMEVYAGSWGGKLRADIAHQYPDIENGKQPTMCFSPDGESLEEMNARAKQWLVSLTEQAIVVSHGQIGFVIRALYTGLSFAEVYAKGDSQEGVYLLHQGEERFIC